MRVPQLPAHAGHVDPLMLGLVALEPAQSLLELPCRAHGVAAPRLVPGDRHVDEPLVEVPLLGSGGAPGELELLVRLEEPLGADVLESRLVRVRDEI